MLEAITNNPISSAFQNISAQQSHGTYRAMDSWSGVRFEVIEAVNGYVLRAASYEGGQVRTFVARNMEELRDLITSDLVAHKLEK
jgi:hypothetical protein